MSYHIFAIAVVALSMYNLQSYSEIFSEDKWKTFSFHLKDAAKSGRHKQIQTILEWFGILLSFNLNWTVHEGSFGVNLNN